jgi:hypothetical protein
MGRLARGEERTRGRRRRRGRAGGGCGWHLKVCALEAMERPHRLAQPISRAALHSPQHLRY